MSHHDVGRGLHSRQQRYDFTHWRDLYDLAEEAKVNISNLTTRLTRLGLLYIDQPTRRLYPNQDAFNGQGSLF